MTNNTSPTIEESLKMIEEKLDIQKNVKKINKNNIKKASEKSVIQKNKPPLKELFKDSKANNKKQKQDGFYLLTKKVGKDGRIVNLQKTEPKPKIKSEERNKQTNFNTKKYKNLDKTGELALIINKLKDLRDDLKRNKNKNNSKKINKEIKKLSETIVLAEDLFKKDLLDL